MKIHKIIVGTDFSSPSEAALEAALDIGRQSGADVVMVRATTIPDHDTQASQPELWERAVSRVAEEHRTRLAEIRAQYQHLGVGLSERVIDAQPAPGLIQSAEELGADLIAVGTHGRTGLSRLLLGSVATRVVRHADTSVLVARPRSGDKFRGRILVPTDFSTCADLALDAAVDLLEPDGHITLLHCLRLSSEIAANWADPEAPDRAGGGLRETLTASAKNEADRRIERYAQTDIEYRCVDSHPSDGIQTALEDEPFDLVVMGSRGRQGLKRWLLGSVAENTVVHAPCSVLVVREPASRSEPSRADDATSGQS